jgi:TonB family protein
VKTVVLGLFLLLTVKSCPAQGAEALCPKHIETPRFPSLARQARITGKVKVTLTINADGNVEDAKAISEAPMMGAHLLLEQSAIQDVQKWTFSKPTQAPFTQIIVFDYQLDETLPLTYESPIIKVVFDLPDHVKIVSNLPPVNPTKSDQKTKIK